MNDNRRQLLRTINEKEFEEWVDATDAPYYFAHSSNWSGIWGSAQAGNVCVQKALLRCTLTIPEIITTATTQSSIVIDTLLTEDLRPVQDECFPRKIIDNGQVKMGEIKIGTDGSITVYSGISSENFEGLGNSGMYGTSVTYLGCLPDPE